MKKKIEALGLLSLVFHVTGTGWSAIVDWRANLTSPFSTEYKCVVLVSQETALTRAAEMVPFVYCVSRLIWLEFCKGKIEMSSWIIQLFFMKKKVGLSLDQFIGWTGNLSTFLLSFVFYWFSSSGCLHGRFLLYISCFHYIAARLYFTYLEYINRRYIPSSIYIFLQFIYDQLHRVQWSIALVLCCL